MKIGTFAGAALAAAMSASMASAAPVQLTWGTTVLAISGTAKAIPATVGEALTTTITVDNGGADVLSQSWGQTDFLSYRIEGASGWWAEIAWVSSWGGAFTTDGAGSVTAAANFKQVGYESMMTSWNGADDAWFWNNGGN
jgi:hypothetical protein